MNPPNKIGVVKKRIRNKQIRQITEGVFSTLFDSTLFFLSLPLFSLGKNPTSYDVYRTFRETERFIEKVNYQTFRRSLDILRRNGLIESIKDWSSVPIITSSGKKRLSSIAPLYQVERPWNGKLYLISYDFEVRQNRQRDVFRHYIKRLNAYLIQKSFYLTIYNPHSFIEAFLNEHQIQSAVFISEMNSKGFLGKENIKEFIWRIAKLDKINSRYQEFINNYSSLVNKKMLFQGLLEYLSIVKNDPQLPFELLQEEYLGDKAYLVYSKLLNSTK